MLINFSNHPSCNWEQRQIEAASIYGEVVDVAFPDVNAADDTDTIQRLADGYVRLIASMRKDSDIIVHVMGEMTFTYAVVSRLKELGIKCVASTTERNAKDIGVGQKLSSFTFVRFRAY